MSLYWGRCVWFGATFSQAFKDKLVKGVMFTKLYGDVFLCFFGNCVSYVLTTVLREIRKILLREDKDLDDEINIFIAA